MSRRSSASRPSGTLQGRDAQGGAPKPASPFSRLRKQLQPAQPAPAPATSAPRRIRHPLEEDRDKAGAEAAADAAAPDAEALELFRRSVGAVRPVRGADRVEIDRPRPAPLP
ncbi:Smr protein/MutS2, partial [Thauera phenylacetica B4P]